MAHFARIDEANIVVDVVVVPDDEAHRGQDFLVNDLQKPGRWVQTSYTGRIRRRFAQIGLLYDEHRDAFIEPSPHPGWVLNENNDWQPPTPKPVEPNVNYFWSDRGQKGGGVKRTTVVVLGEGHVE